MGQASQPAFWFLKRTSQPGMFCLSTLLVRTTKEISAIVRIRTRTSLTSAILRPFNITNDSDAKAFYGAFSDILKQQGRETLDFEEGMGTLALNVKQAVQSLARVDWRTSVPIHKKMNQAIEDLLWDFCDEYDLVKSRKTFRFLLQNFSYFKNSRKMPFGHFPTKMIPLFG